MRRNAQRKQSGIPFENHPPGCMWGLLHMLDYHHWRHVKKMLPYKRRGGGKCAGARGDYINIPSDELTENFHAEMNSSAIEEKNTESGPSTKISVKSRLKARFSVDLSRRKGKHQRSSTSPAQLQIDSVHNLEVSNQNSIDEIISKVKSPRYARLNNECPVAPIKNKKKCKACGNKHPSGHTCVDDVHGNQSGQNHTLLQDKLNHAKQNLLKQKLMYAKEQTKDAPLYQSKEFLDALDIVNLDKEIFIKVLEDQASPLADHFHCRALSPKIGLDKCGSFPIAGPLKKRVPEPGELEHKIKEIQTNILAEKEIEYISSMINDNGNTNADQEVQGNGSSNETQEPIKRFKYLKQKLKQAINERKKERHRITMDAFLHKIPYGRNKDAKKEISLPWKDHGTEIDRKFSPSSSYGSDHSGLALKKRLHRMRRTSSLTDSLHRYCELYESTFNRESKCNSSSENVKLKTKEVNLQRDSLTRIYSLPDLKSYYYLQNEDSSDASSSGIQNGNMDTFGDQKILDNIPTGLDGETKLETFVESVREDNLVKDNEISPNLDDHLQSPSWVAFSDVNLDVPSVINETASPSELTTEMLELTPTSKDRLEDSCMDLSAATKSEIDLEKLDIPSKNSDSKSLRFQHDTKNIIEFNYVRNVLEYSGFMKNVLGRTWNTSDLPVDPSVYEEMEGDSPHEHEHSENEEAGYSNHLLLFDVTNEVLMEIYESSLSYCPIHFSSRTRIRPMPAGHRVLEEVWENISWYLNSKPEADQSLDYLVDRDLSKGDKWMNLQFDSECVGLELEDLIFDDLLEEFASELISPAASSNNLP